MSVRWHDAALWVEYVERVAGIVDVGRERLQTQHFELVYGQRASLVVPLARVAVGQLIAVIRRRTEQFATGQENLPNGTAWNTLRAEFLTACGSVRGVCSTLTWDVERVLIDDVTLPNPTRLDNVRLYAIQRDSLVSAQQSLDGKTRQFIDHATVLVATGHTASLLWTPEGV